MGKDDRTGLLGWLTSRRGWVVFACMVAMTPFIFGGCFGRFPLTRQLYQFNQEVSEDRMVRTVVFWVMVIVPVYNIGMLADAIVFNLIEFWTGEELLTAGPTMDANGNVVLLTPSEDGTEAVMTVSRDGEVISEQSFVKVSDTTFEVRDQDGTVRGTVQKAEDGSIFLTDADGTLVDTLHAEDIAAMGL